MLKITRISKIIFRFMYFMCVSILPACMYLFHVYPWCPWQSAGPVFPVAGVFDLVYFLV